MVYENSGCAIRCLMLSSLPVERSSRTSTSSPRSRRASARCDPMKPAPPVINTRMKSFLQTKELCELEPPDDRHAGAVPAERAASQALIEDPAAGHLQCPRLVNADRCFGGCVASEPERGAEVVALCADPER